MRKYKNVNYVLSFWRKNELFLVYWPLYAPEVLIFKFQTPCRDQIKRRYREIANRIEGILDGCERKMGGRIHACKVGVFKHIYNYTKIDSVISFGRTEGHWNRWSTFMGLSKRKERVETSSRNRKFQEVTIDTDKWEMNC